MPRLWRLIARTGGDRFGDAEAGEFVGALVAGVAAVASPPYSLNEFSSAAVSNPLAEV